VDVDRILAVMNRHHVSYLVFGGVNFMLRHAPVVTLDIDLWIEDVPENLARCQQALAELEAGWGPSESEWLPVAQLGPGWLGSQGVFCLMSPHGPIDVFRSVRGLPDWAVCRARAAAGKTAAGTAFLGLADEDMLRCQLALPPGQQKPDRIRILKQSLQRGEHEQGTG
jgi:hypothetical protein